MLNIIICEDNEVFMKKNVDSINIALANSDVDYRIRKFDGYCDELGEIIRNKEIKKIYLLDVEIDGTSGLEIASKIRENDWDSIIIIATAYDKYHNDVFYTRLMVLDFICKYKGYEERLVDDMKAAVDITCKQSLFVFKYSTVLKPFLAENDIVVGKVSLFISLVIVPSLLTVSFVV